MNSGVYRITNIVNGKAYIGQSKDYIGRWKKHIKSNMNEHLKKDILEYGPESFKIELLVAAVDRSYMRLMETKCILAYNSLYPNGYNIKFDDTLAQSQKDKISKTLKARPYAKRKPLSLTAKQNISNSCKGRVLSKESLEQRERTRIERCTTNKGLIRSPEVIAQRTKKRRENAVLKGRSY